MKRFVMLSLFFLVVMTGCEQMSGAGSQSTKLTVSAAASMSESLQEVKKAFEAEYPTIDITYNFGGSGTLRKQIEQGAPVDLFFSASRKDYEALKADEKIKHGSAILENQLVVITSDDMSFDSFEAFYESDKEMAIGTPVAVPAGSYSKQVLQKMDVWDGLQDRLVLTKDVQQVLTYVKDGVVDVGMVYVSDLHQAENSHVLETIDPSYHQPIEYFAASIQPEGNQTEAKAEAAKAFFDYVQNETSMEVFDRYGFQTNSREKE